MRISPARKTWVPLIRKKQQTKTHERINALLLSPHPLHRRRPIVLHTSLYIVCVHIYINVRRSVVLEKRAPST